MQQIRGVRWTSSTRVGELPLLVVAVGPDLERGEMRVAIGCLAAGGAAVGGVAIGGLAVGYYAVGGVALGPHAFGPMVSRDAMPQWLGHLMPWLRS